MCVLFVVVVTVVVVVVTVIKKVLKSVIFLVGMRCYNKISVFGICIRK